MIPFILVIQRRGSVNKLDNSCDKGITDFYEKISVDVPIIIFAFQCSASDSCFKVKTFQLRKKTVSLVAIVRLVNSQRFNTFSQHFDIFGSLVNLSGDILIVEICLLDDDLQISQNKASVTYQPIEIIQANLKHFFLGKNRIYVWRIIAKQEQLSIDFSLNIGIYGICIISGKDWGVNR